MIDGLIGKVPIRFRCRGLREQHAVLRSCISACVRWWQLSEAKAAPRRCEKWRRHCWSRPYRRCSYRLQATGYRLQATGYRLQAKGVGRVRCFGTWPCLWHVAWQVVALALMSLMQCGGRKACNVRQSCSLHVHVENNIERDQTMSARSRDWSRALAAASNKANVIADPQTLMET